MRIWNLETGEPKAFLRNATSVARLGRAHSISLLYARSGHDVKHFVSNFNHVDKKIDDLPCSVEIETNYPNIKYVVLKSSGYAKNVSVGRIKDHFTVAWSFKRFCDSNKTKPDLIIVSLPTIELAFVAVRYARKNKIKIVVDFRDLWPDIFLYHFLPKSPRLVNALLRMLPWYWMNMYIFRNASVVSTVGKGFSRYVKNRYLGDTPKQTVTTIYQSQRQLLIDEKMETKGKCIRFLWTGNIVAETDFSTLEKAVEYLVEKNVEFELWIAGTGSALHDRKTFFDKYSNVVKLLGWLNESQLIEALNSCDVGLLCYLDRIDFRMAIQNKVVDYLRSGLPIIGSIDGELKFIDELESANIYHHYRFGDSIDLAEKIEYFVLRGVNIQEKNKCIDLYNKYFNDEVVERKWLSILG